MSRGRERERVDRPHRSHLPRLARDHYRGHAYVHWVLSVQGRATGWLTAAFPVKWQIILLHACARHRLLVPAYTLMPDHAHLLWVGLDSCGSDQRVALEFLRSRLRTALQPARWQAQAYDHVLRESERAQGAVAATASYITHNPVRSGFVSHAADWPFSGCCVPGYPDLDVHAPEYCPLLWRIHARLARG